MLFYGIGMEIEDKMLYRFRKVSAGFHYRGLILGI